MASMAILIVLACLLGVAGCRSQSSSQSINAQQGGPSTENGKIVGTWAISMGGTPTADAPTWQFTQDGKIIQKAPAVKGGVINAQDTYALSGNTLLITTKTGSGASSTSTQTLQWVSDDKVRVSMSKAWLTLTRKK